MKKLTIIFLVCLCLVLFGCNNSAENNKTATTTEPITQETTTVSVPTKEFVINEIAGDESTLLNEFTLQDIQSAWGKADEFVEEENAYKWYTNGVKAYIFIFCDENDNVTETQFRSVFKAEVYSDTGVLFVTPCEDEWQSQSDGEDLCIVSLKNEKERENFEKGTIVQIEYDGAILESYPIQIRAYSVTVCE